MSSTGPIGTIGSTLAFSFGFGFRKVSSLLCRLFPLGWCSLSTDPKRHSLLKSAEIGSTNIPISLPFSPVDHLQYSVLLTGG